MRFRELEDLMRENGFMLSRKDRHAIWTDGVTVLVTSRTPSDHRAEMNIVADIRRAVRKRESLTRKIDEAI